MEEPKYKPEDVLVTEGIDKGRIKDVELAQDMAEAEDKVREEARNPLNERQIKNLADSNWVTTEELVNDVANEKTNKVVADEIGKRVEEEIRSEGIDDTEFISTQQRKAADDVIKAQQDLASERREEVKQKYLEEQE
jgi:predicted Fe-Mo cluster-binding NifX family protein